MKKTIVAVVIGLAIVAAIITFGQVFTVRYVDVPLKNSVQCTDVNEIVELAGIKANTNIFTLNEKEIKKKIEEQFDTNTLHVDDIVRRFPDKVLIEVSERTALYKIEASVDNLYGYVTADKNFQRNTLYSEETLSDKTLIEVEGFVVEGDFNVEECYILQQIANSAIACGIREEGIPFFIRSVTFDEDTVSVQLRVTDTVFVLSKEKALVKTEFAKLYLQYVAVLPDARDGMIFNA